MSWENEQRVHVPSIFVQEQNKTTRDTGLLDKDGNKITVEEKREQIGFIHFEQRS